VLEDTSKRRPLPSKPWFWGSRVGRLAWGIAEIAMPRPPWTIPGLLFQYWSQIAILLAAVLILLGVVGVEGAQKVGWILLAVVVGARAIVWLAEQLMAPPRPRPLHATAGPPRPGETASTRASKAIGLLGLMALAVAGGGVLLVLAGLFSEPLLEPGWWVVAGGLLAAFLAFLVRVSLASRRRLLALVLAAVAFAVIGLAALEIGGHLREDLDTAGEWLPGSRGEGFEETVRYAADKAWDRLWPW
jgi:hypothetical protein